MTMAGGIGGLRRLMPLMVFRLENDWEINKICTLSHYGLKKLAGFCPYKRKLLHPWFTSAHYRSFHSNTAQNVPCLYDVGYV